MVTLELFWSVQFPLSLEIEAWIHIAAGLLLPPFTAINPFLVGGE